MNSHGRGEVGEQRGGAGGGPPPPPPPPPLVVYLAKGLAKLEILEL